MTACPRHVKKVGDGSAERIIKLAEHREKLGLPGRSAKSEATRKIGAVPQCVKLEMRALAAPAPPMNPEPIAPKPAPDYQLEKRQTLWLLLALFFVAGWFSAIITEKSSLFLSLPINRQPGHPQFSSCAGWCSTPCNSASKSRRSGYFSSCFFSFLIVPFYLIRTRGKNAWRLILAEIALLFVYSIAMGVGRAIATAVGL